MSLPRRLLAALALLLLGAGSAMAAGCDAPVATVHPGAAADVTPSSAAFAGIWQGQWAVAVHDHAQPICARLYVSVIASATATVEQCTGSNRDAKRRPECKQFAAEIDGNVMTFSDLQGTVYTFTMADVGGMKGEAISAQHRSITVFVKPE
jgi:hypothetical protein